MARYVFDAETDGLLGELTKFHSLVLQDVDTEEVLSFADQPGYRPIVEGLQVLADAAEIIGHNIISFDIPAIRKVYPEWKTGAKVTDTLILSSLFFPDLKGMDIRAREKSQAMGREPKLPGQEIGRHRLKAWGYRLGIHKGAFGDTDDWSRWSKDMQVYCERDVLVTLKLYRMMTSKFDLEDEWARAIDLEMRFQHLVSLQERHGFRFNTAGAERLEVEIRGRKAEAEAKLSNLFAPWWVGTQVTTPKMDRKVFIESDIGAQSRTVKKETGETYVHTFKNGKTQRRKVKVDVVQQGFCEHTSEGCPYTKVELRVFNPGSRHHIADRLQKLYGWTPAEFTDSGQVKIDDDILSDLPYPPAQALAEVFMLEKRLSAIADGKQAWLKNDRGGRIHGRVNGLGTITGRCSHSHPNIAQVPSIENAKGKVPYGQECRALFLPDEGHVLLGCDAAGLELRCLGHFIRDGGRYANIVINGKKEDGTDVHTMNQKSTGLPTRNGAKRFIYMFLYGGGDRLAGEIVAPDAPPSEQVRIGKAIKRKFLQNTPGLSGLIDAVKKAARRQCWIRGIDGRRITIRSAHAALNSLLQNAGAVAMKLAPVLLYERLIEEGFEWGPDFAFVAHVHDEMQISVRPEIAEYIGEMANWSITEAGRQLGFKCELAGEADVGSSWAETH